MDNIFIFSSAKDLNISYVTPGVAPITAPTIDIFENLSVNVSDEELERNESVELPSIQDITSGQILAEDLYTVKDIFFLARNHMIESSDIEKMRIYEDEDNGVRIIWVQSLQE